jgi:hypothetical protein
VQHRTAFPRQKWSFFLTCVSLVLWTFDRPFKDVLQGMEIIFLRPVTILAESA